MIKITGRCLCEEVKFELTAEFTGFYFCHCSRCQKSTGTVHGSNLFFSNANLTWASGLESLASYQHKKTRFIKNFCSHCASPLPKEVCEQSQMVQVPVGCLDEDVYFEPTAHLFINQKRCWEEKLTSLKSFSGLPD